VHPLTFSDSLASLLRHFGTCLFGMPPSVHMDSFKKVDKIMRENEATWQALSDEEVDELLYQAYARLKGPGCVCAYPQSGYPQPVCARARKQHRMAQHKDAMQSCYAPQTRLARAVMGSKVLGEEDQGRGLSAHKRCSSSSALLQAGSTQLTGLYLMARNKSSGTGTRSSGGGSTSNAARPGRGAGIYTLA
jgi:hypothetical protein